MRAARPRPAWPPARSSPPPPRLPRPPAAPARAATSLAPGAFITCTASYAVTQADLDAGSVHNYAFATGSFNASPVVSNTDDLIITATQTPSLSLDKTISAGDPHSQV